MRCTSCGFENPQGMKFCGNCATPLKSICPNCGFENPPDFKFCGSCAHPLATPQAAPASAGSGLDVREKAAFPLPATSPVVTQRPAEAERRQLTVMFCDLVGSTTLSESLDPEELREIVRAYQQASAEAIVPYEGHIAQYLGDGLLIYFGYPAAHEDDAQRAVRAGLGIVDAVARLAEQVGQERRVPLAVRLGIHTGPVVVGEMGGGGRQEQLAMGETPNIAARLQGLADPGSLVISAATYRLIRRSFACRPLGSHALKGLSQPIELYRVLSDNDLGEDLPAVWAAEVTPLVGREQEVGLLVGRWGQAREGEGQVIMLSAEAGMGKSRLVEAFKEQVVGEPHARLECRCSPYHQNSALHPVIDLILRSLRYGRKEPPDETLRKLEELLGRHGLPLEEGVPLFASLLSLPVGDRYPPANLTPQRRKQKTFEAVLGMLSAMTAEQPLLFIAEDLHWADPSTLELFGLLIDQGPTTPICFLLTFRPDFRPPWPIRSHMVSIPLSRLGRKQVEAMIRQTAGGRTLPDEVAEQLVAKTDGVPLFVEELTKMVLESGLLREREDRYELTGPLPPLAIPTTLHDSLMARLDRLATVKEVAQLAATLGREFSYDLIRAVSPLDEEVLRRELNLLIEAELLYQRGLPPQATFYFKHALIQETAYNALLKNRRQLYHRQIGQALEERFPEITAAQPELVAHHYTEAGLGEQAIPYWQRAGQRAIQQSANLEAIGHLSKGLQLLRALPETPARAGRELELQTALGVPLTATKGLAAPEVERAYARALELCSQMGRAPQVFPVLRGLWNFYLVRARYDTAQELGERLLHLAESGGEEALFPMAHRSLAAALCWQGRFAEAREHCDRGLALYDRNQHPAHALLAGQDPAVTCLTYAAWSLWFLGYPDQALERSNQAVQLAEELSHAHSLVYALVFAAALHQFRREPREAQRLAEAAISLSTEQGFAAWLGTGTFFRGWARAAEGHYEEGSSQMRDGMQAWTDAGSELARPWMLVLRAEAHLRVGRHEESRHLLEEAFRATQQSGEQFYETEIHRMSGESLLRRSPEDAERAEASFLRALELARSQQAKSMELRAAISLSRLRQMQGDDETARKMLESVYGCFTEGVETGDLREARDLLAQLS